MFRQLFRLKWLVVPALLMLVAGVAVEGGTRSLSRRARHSLQSTQRDAQRTADLEPQTRLVLQPNNPWRGVRGLAHDLDVEARRAPSEFVHRAAAQAWLSAGEGVKAARHLQLAARLAPEDKDAQRRAEKGVSVALLFQARDYTRPAGFAGGALLVLMGFGGMFARGRRRRLRKYVENLRADVRIKVDGEHRRQPAVGPHAEAATIDLFLKGRHGMCCPRLRRKRPPIHVTFSNAEASRTVRLTPVRETGDAIRIHVRPDTLDLLRAAPGEWRMHVRMNDRTLALATVAVNSPPSKRPILDRARGWFGGGAVS